MRIAHFQEIIPVAPAIGEQLLEAARFLYGGELIDYGGDLRYISSDGRVEGWFGENPDKEDPQLEAGIAISELYLPSQARRWVATHAYLQRADQQPTTAIALESEQAHLVDAWRDSKRARGAELIVSSLNGSTILASIGANVIDAASRLAENYKDLNARTSEDPQRQVARALGAPSMATLTRTWELSRMAAGPLAAARLVLDRLGLAID